MLWSLVCTFFLVEWKLEGPSMSSRVEMILLKECGLRLPLSELQMVLGLRVERRQEEYQT